MSRKIPAKHAVTVTDSERGLRDTESGKLIFTEYRGRQCALLLKGGRLIAATFLSNVFDSAIGAIYIGKVKNIAKNIDACFVETGEGQICFLPLKKAATPFLTNRIYDGRLLEGDELLVQIERDAQKNKQPSVTAHISLANDYFALILGAPRLGFSSKLDRIKREDISKLFAENDILINGQLAQTQDTSLPSVGAIARTRLGALTDENEILESFWGLSSEFLNLLRTARTRSCYTCIQPAPLPWEAAIHSLAYPEEYREVVTDSPALYEELEAYCTRHLPDKELRLYQDKKLSLEKLYSLESRMDSALKPKVWLKSGGYLIIETTEALTVIDVNSGKNDGVRDAAETIRRLNLEAAEEIALQLRLRNLSGIIIVDFVNMEEEKSGIELLEHLRELVGHDHVKTTVVDITPLGLVEITRKKTAPPLAEQMD